MHNNNNKMTDESSFYLYFYFHSFSVGRVFFCCLSFLCKCNCFDIHSLHDSCFGLCFYFHSDSFRLFWFFVCFFVVALFLFAQFFFCCSILWFSFYKLFIAEPSVRPDTTAHNVKQKRRAHEIEVHVNIEYCICTQTHIYGRNTTQMLRAIHKCEFNDQRCCLFDYFHCYYYFVISFRCSFCHTLVASVHRQSRQTHFPYITEHKKTLHQTTKSHCFVFVLRFLLLFRTLSAAK